MRVVFNKLALLSYRRASAAIATQAIAIESHFREWKKRKSPVILFAWHQKPHRNEVVNSALGVMAPVFALDVEKKDRESQIILFFTPRRMNIYDEIGKHMTARCEGPKTETADCRLFSPLREDPQFLNSTEQSSDTQCKGILLFMVMSANRAVCAREVKLGPEIFHFNGFFVVRWLSRCQWLAELRACANEKRRLHSIKDSPSISLAMAPLVIDLHLKSLKKFPDCVRTLHPNKL